MLTPQEFEALRPTQMLYLTEIWNQMVPSLARAHVLSRRIISVGPEGVFLYQSPSHESLYFVERDVLLRVHAENYWFIKESEAVTYMNNLNLYLNARRR